MVLRYLKKGCSVVKSKGWSLQLGKDRLFERDKSRISARYNTEKEQIVFVRKTREVFTSGEAENLFANTLRAAGEPAQNLKDRRREARTTEDRAG